MSARLGGRRAADPWPPTVSEGPGPGSGSGSSETTSIPCYDTAGYYSCACDAALKREATTVEDGSNASLQVRRRALSVVEATAAMDCRAP